MPIHDWTRVNAGIFHHFHNAWIVRISDALNDGILPPSYYALGEQVAGEIGPDVLTLHDGIANGTPPTDDVLQGAVAVAVAPPKVRFTARIEMEHYARKQTRLVIRHSSNDRVIAILEILSLGNKASAAMLQDLVDKAVSAINRRIHLTLVDLYPPTPRDPEGIHGLLWSEFGDSSYAAPQDKPLTVAAYEAGLATACYVEPVAAGDPLPDIPLFLAPGAYVPLPLEATYVSAYRGVPDRWRRVLEG
jgi:hypothetical protein